jgi:hypothetical protein
MKENTKQRITTPFLNFWTDDQRICQDEGNKGATTLILLYFGSLLQWMNAWQILVGLSSDDWFKPLVVFIFVVEELELWIGNFFYSLPTQYLIATVGWVLPRLFPFQIENRRVSFGYVKPPGWLTHGSCKQLKRTWILDPIPLHGSQ